MGNRMKAYTVEEAGRIVEFLKGRPGVAAKRDLAQLYLSIAWAIRAGEERQLLVSDFFGKGWKWRDWAVIDAWRVKRTHGGRKGGRRTGRQHRYRIGPEVRAVVGAWLAALRQLRPVRYSDPVFSKVERGEAISREYMWRRVKRWCRGAGVSPEGHGTHSGRKTGSQRLKSAMERDAQRERRAALRKGRAPRERDAEMETIRVTHHASPVELRNYLAEPDEALEERVWEIAARETERLAAGGWS